MHLTQHSDYALRVLVYLAANPDRHVSTDEIARAYDISIHHLVKVVNRLGQAGFLDVKRGRGGGVALGRLASEVRLGHVVRKTEPHFAVVECLGTDPSRCPIDPVCGLKAPLREALDAFLATLDRYTLADVVDGPGAEAYRERFLVAPG